MVSRRCASQRNPEAAVIKIVFFVPSSHLEQVKDAVFAAGGGRMGRYDRCCWQTLGKGQFRPAEGSTPFLGSAGELEQVDEFRVELVCAEEFALAAVDALVAAHPYETPAYEALPVFDRTGLVHVLRSTGTTAATTSDPSRPNGVD